MSLNRPVSALAAALLFAASAVAGQDVTEAQAREIRTRYPGSWEVQVPEGTVLAAIKQTYSRRLARMTARDLEDTSPYPLWFRAYLRDQLGGLPTAGPYQYPRVAAQILEWMLANPDLRVREPSEQRRLSRTLGAPRVVAVGSNVNVSNLDERNSESFVAVNYADPRLLIAGSNNITGSGRQKQFRSADGGVTWTAGELPLAPGSAFQSDPALSWSTDGTAWAATLGINGAGNQVLVQVFKSTDHGATWSFVSTLSTGNDNDKELMWIDADPASPFRDNIYLAWDVPGGGMRFARSTDGGASFSPPTNLSSDAAIGAHLSTGPSGEVYVAWPDTSSRQLRVRKSTDGGASFGPVRTIATTNDAYEISIPAMCSRKVLIYLAIGVDRSSGPNRGSVYAVWTDRNGAADDPGCAGIASDSNANVYFSASRDGGTTWSPPAIVHTNPPRTDQFNPWMDVDPDDGTIHVAFYDTRDDAGRVRTHLYYVRSEDGGATWVDEIRAATSPTDETATSADSGNQYGDYNGLAAFQGVAHPVWTDRRSGVPSDKEQIFTARIERRALLPPPCPHPPCIDLCLQQPWICGPVDDMRLETIELECALRGCVKFDPIPKNCLVKWNCPGCSPGGLCPPFYNVFLDGLEDVWAVGLFDPAGEPVPFARFDTDQGVVLSFRPDEKLFIDGQIGDYLLVFQMGPNGKPGQRYEIKTRVEASDQQFSPGGPP
jgi:hypothetical protein